MYLALKLLHIVAVIAFLGNITTGLFWKRIADRTGDRRIIAHTLRGIISSDRLLTIPGIVLILIGGFGAAGVAGLPILGTGWILWSLVLFIISGFAFMPVSRSQREMLEVAAAGSDDEAVDWDRYHRLSRRWDVWGLIALVAPVIAVVFMVLKPVLPALHR